MLDIHLSTPYIGSYYEEKQTLYHEILDDSVKNRPFVTITILRDVKRSTVQLTSVGELQQRQH